MLATFESAFASIFATTGGMVLLLVQSVLDIRLGPHDLRRLLKQMIIVGWQTLPIGIMIGFFTGMIVALNTGIELSRYGLSTRIGSIVSVSMVREMGPVFTAFIVAARVGSSMAAELGTMVVSDEVDVLRVLGIRVERYLVMPRIVASVLMTPILTVYSTLMGMWGGKLVSSIYLGVSAQIYQQRAINALDMTEIQRALTKAAVFGLVYSTICCYQGLNCKEGAEGVGRATTSAVVMSFSAILVVDYLLTRFMFG